MWRRVDLVLTDVSEEHIASIFKVNLTTQVLYTKPNNAKRLETTSQ
jgi:hypothetical protein